MSERVSTRFAAFVALLLFVGFFIAGCLEAVIPGDGRMLMSICLGVFFTSLLFFGVWPSLHVRGHLEMKELAAWPDLRRLKVVIARTPRVWNAWLVCFIELRFRSLGFELLRHATSRWSQYGPLVWKIHAVSFDLPTGSSAHLLANVVFGDHDGCSRFSWKVQIIDGKVYERINDALILTAPITSWAPNLATSFEKWRLTPHAAVAA